MPLFPNIATTIILFGFQTLIRISQNGFFSIIYKKYHKQY